MGIVVTSLPPKWDSASRPLETTFTSTLFPASLPGEAFLPIFEIRKPNAFELANLIILDENDVIVTGNFASASFVVGDYVKIENTSQSAYLGVFRVTKAPNTDIIAIEAVYTIDDQFGTVSRYYNNFALYCSVTGSNDGFNPIVYPLQPNASNEFILNVSDQMQRTFPSPFTEVYPFNTPPTGTGSNLRSVVQAYGVTVGEAYDVPTNGIPEFFNPGPAIKLVSNRYVINSQHPYHEVDRDGNTVLLWESTYDNYIVNNAITGSAKFLTYGPRNGEQCVTEEDDFFLVYLWDGNRNNGVELTVSRYTAAGTFIANTDIPFAPPEAPGAYALNVGPSQLLGLIEDNAAYYIVALQNGGEQLITEPFRLTMCRDCTKASRRMFWRNALGGIDQFTFTAREDEAVTSERQTVRKPYMPRLFRYIESNERVYRTDIERTYEAWAKPHTYEVQRWLARDLYESADIVTPIVGDRWTRVIPIDVDIQSDTTRNGSFRASIRYRLGVDNIKQGA